MNLINISLNCIKSAVELCVFQYWVYLKETVLDGLGLDADYQQEKTAF